MAMLGSRSNLHGTVSISYPKLWCLSSHMRESISVYIYPVISHSYYKRADVYTLYVSLSASRASTIFSNLCLSSSSTVSASRGT